MNKTYTTETTIISGQCVRSVTVGNVIGLDQADWIWRKGEKLKGKECRVQTVF